MTARVAAPAAVPPTPASGTGGTARARLLGLWTTAVAATAAATGAAVVAWRADLGQRDARLVEVPVIAACCLLGALILTSRPGQPVGRTLLAGGALWGAFSLPVELLVPALAADPLDRTAAAALTVAFTLRGLGWLVLVVVLPIVFPDGPTARGRWWLRLALADLALFAVVLAAQPVLIDDRLPTIGNPLGLPADLAPVAEGGAAVGLLVGLACLVAGLLSVAHRWRSGGPLVRQQVGWFTLGLFVTVAGGVVLAAAAGEVAARLFALSVAALPVAIGLAVLQHRLYEVDRLVNRTLVYLALTAAVAVVYVLVVAGVGAALDVRGAGWLPWVATAAVAVAVQPLREAIQASVNRVTFGAWEEPERLIGSVHDRLEQATGPREALCDVLGRLVESLRLDAVAVLTPEGTVLATAGTPAGGPTRSAPLVHAGRPVGTLVVEGGRRRRRDEQTLSGLAAALAPAVQAARLHGDLQRSRERLVVAREEERRRLRRDLHDGLGSALAGLTLKVDTARNTLGDSARLREIRSDVQAAVADVRRLVEGLRPVALDELGLAGALDRLVSRTSRGELPVRLRTEGLGAPPAAVEVAAYRIVQEALTNVLRHSGARSCEVEVRGEHGSVVVTVTDDGRGPASAGVTGAAAGSGLETMRERAEELGGSVTVRPRPGGGTVVRAALPWEDG